MECHAAGKTQRASSLARGERTIFETAWPMHFIMNGVAVNFLVDDGGRERTIKHTVRQASMLLAVTFGKFARQTTPRTQQAASPCIKKPIHSLRLWSFLLWMCICGALLNLLSALVEKLTRENIKMQFDPGLQFQRDAVIERKSWLAYFVCSSLARLLSTWFSYINVCFH